MKLTQITQNAGCEIKLDPMQLHEMLGQIANIEDPRLISGINNLDDAAVIKMRDDLALVFSVDIITPVVDDPFDWGGIAAANSLSDIYAMGAKPLCALNISCFPCSFSTHIKGEILAGGQAIANKANCLIVGGHTIVDQSPKYGMAVVGTIQPDRVISNRGVKSGDILYLSKHLGTGVITKAIKMEIASKELIKAATEDMLQLNEQCSQIAIAANANALTDITGFGLIGHLSKFLPKKANLKAVIHVSKLPVIDGALSFIRQGIVAEVHHLKYAFGSIVNIKNEIDKVLEYLCYYPQTSGGLLCSIPETSKDFFETESRKKNIAIHQIGYIESGCGIELDI